LVVQLWADSNTYCNIYTPTKVKHHPILLSIYCFISILLKQWNIYHHVLHFLKDYTKSCNITNLRSIYHPERRDYFEVICFMLFNISHPVWYLSQTPTDDWLNINMLIRSGSLHTWTHNHCRITLGRIHHSMRQPNT
jgi:hypothetical protein